MEIDGIRMLIGLVIGITLLIMLVLKTKVQTFLALIISTIVIGLIGGMPLTATELWMPQVMPGQASVSSIPSQVVLAERWEALESSSDSAL